MRGGQVPAGEYTTRGQVDLLEFAAVGQGRDQAGPAAAAITGASAVSTRGAADRSFVAKTWIARESVSSIRPQTNSSRPAAGCRG